MYSTTFIQLSHPTVPHPESVASSTVSLVHHSQQTFLYGLDYRAARVCTLWRDLSTHQSLWRSVDLSYGWIKSTDRTLQWLCDHRLQNTQVISLSGWKALTSATLQNLVEKCRDLTSVTLSYCSKVTTDGWMALATHCKLLSDVDLSFSSVSMVYLPRHLSNASIPASCRQTVMSESHKKIKILSDLPC